MTIADKLAALEAALVAAEAQKGTQAAKIADLEGQLLDPKELAILDALVARAQALTAAPSA